jgi:uncharacterized protein (TIGR02452 family)
MRYEGCMHHNSALDARKRSVMLRVPELPLPAITHDMLNMPIRVARQLDGATRDIVQRGWYINGTHTRVPIEHLQLQAQQRTYVDGASLRAKHRFVYTQTEVRVSNQTLLNVGQAWHQRGYRVALVNPLPLHCHALGHEFGDSELGALYRGSGIRECLQQLYPSTRATHYQHYLITTQRLPIFRNHDGDLLTTPWLADVITTETLATPANPFAMANWEGDMATWMVNLIQVAARLDVNVLVIGMWQPMQSQLTAQIIRQTLDSLAMPSLAVVNFAIPDVSPHQTYIRPFIQLLSGMRLNQALE